MIRKEDPVDLVQQESDFFTYLKTFPYARLYKFKNSGKKDRLIAKDMV